MSRAQRQELELWATLTIRIGYNLRAPAEQKEHLYQGLMIVMDPENYQAGSNVRKLVTRLRSEIRRAVQRATQTTHGTQTSSPTSTITAPSTGNNHPNTHNHTVSPATAKHKTPPPPLIDTSNSDRIPHATNVNHAPTINPHRVDGRQARDNNNTINEPHYEQDIRWAVTESLASLTREQNATQKSNITPVAHQAQHMDQHHQAQ